MTVDASTFCTIDANSLLIRAPGITLDMDKRTGDWCQIGRGQGGPRLVPVGGARRCFDLQFDGDWITTKGEPEVIQWEQRNENDRFAVRVDIQLGPFHVRQWIWIDTDGNGFQRELELVYRGKKRGVLRAIELSLPAIRLNDSDTGLLLFPNHTDFRSLTTEDLARRSITRDRIDADFEAGRTCPGGIETFPDSWNGLIAVYDGPSQVGFATYLSPPPVPVAFGCTVQDGGFAISAFQRTDMFIDPGVTLRSATQYGRLFSSGWLPMLEEYRKKFHSWGFEPRGNVPSWISGATLYETAISEWGGIVGLIRALPDLRALGIDTLNLLPIWAGAEVTEEMKQSWRLDRSWQGRTLPDRITDFEALDPEIGSSDAVRELVSEAHSLGMKVVVDFVFHGVSEPSWLLQRRPNWFVRNAEGDAVATHGWEPGFSLDWANPEVQEFLVDFGVLQVQMYQLDGLRAVTPFWKESNWGCSDGRQPYQTSLAGMTILERLRMELSRVRPDVVVLSGARGPGFVGRCDALCASNVIHWFAGLARGEISERELHANLQDLRSCYAQGTLLQFALEDHRSILWEKSPTALRGSAISRPLFAVAALAGDLVSICYGQERGQEEYIGELLSVRKSSETLTQGVVLHHGVAWNGVRQFAFVRHMGASFAIITANFDSVWCRTRVRIDKDLLFYFTRDWVNHQRLYPARSGTERVPLDRLEAWEVELPPFAVAIDLFEE